MSEAWNTAWLMRFRSRRIVCALLLAAAPTVAAAQRDLSHVAPADRYFGRLKLSYLTINNTFQHAAISAGNHTTDPRIAHKIDFAMEALNDWERLYPRDPHLPRSYFLGQLTLKKIWIKKYQDKAWEYMQYIVATFPATYFGKTVKGALANGFTQHYFAKAVVCTGGAPASPAVPADNGKFKVVVHTPPCVPPEHRPTAGASAKPPGQTMTLEPTGKPSL
jgi:hypothetical protein